MLLRVFCFLFTLSFLFVAPPLNLLLLLLLLFPDKAAVESVEASLQRGVRIRAEAKVPLA